MRSSKERTETYKQVLIKKRLKIDLGLVTSTDLTRESTHQAMQQLLSQRPRQYAILAINDYIALDAMQYARQQKLKVGKDICFVSYANLPITSYLLNNPLLWPFSRTISQCGSSSGAKAATEDTHSSSLHKSENEKPVEPETFLKMLSSTGNL